MLAPGVAMDAGTLKTELAASSYRDDGIGKSGDTDALENRFDLRRNDVDGLPGIALRQRLTDAQHRAQAGRQSCGKLLGNQRIGLAVDRTTLGVANQHVLAGKIVEHRGTDFAGKSALRLFAEVLRTPRDRRSGQHRLRLREIGKRNANRGAHAFEVSDAGQHTLQQLQIALQTAVHFPVTRYELLTHGTPREKGGIIAK